MVCQFPIIIVVCVIVCITGLQSAADGSKRLVLHSDVDLVTTVQRLEQEIRSLQSKVSEQDSKLAAKMGVGSTYIRWGRTICNTNGTELVYPGFAGGSFYSTTGGSADFICLTSKPLWGAYDDTHQSNEARIYGAEYEFGEDFSDGGSRFFGSKIHDHDVPCAVCLSSRSATVMIPGRNQCYLGWTEEYAGYLVSGRGGDASASQYVCLDSRPEVELGDHNDEDGKLMVMVESVCGSLKCPPYADNRELTCIVCSK